MTPPSLMGNFQEGCARRESWKIDPLIEPVALPFTCRFTASEFELIKQGLVPQSMEEKWFIYFEWPNLHLHRSWTGLAVYRLELQKSGADDFAAAAVCAASVLANSSAEYQATLLDFLIKHLLLKRHVPFPRPASASVGVYQFSVAGTLVDEIEAPPDC